MFINRKKELKALNTEYNKNQARFAVIYGRRRVGKTALISEFIKDKNALYFYATTSSDAPNVFGKALAKSLDIAHFDKMSFDSFSKAFELLITTKPKDKLIIAIDEFQNLAIADKDFISEFQKIYDEIIAKNNIFLIICGSVISMMHSLALDYSAPLYGRRTLNMRIQPLDFIHLKDFLPSLDSYTRMLVYSAFGAVPKYLQSYDENLDFWDNVEENILDKNSYLYAEGQFLLNTEINESASYFSILEAISKGNQKIGSIASVLGVSSTHLTRYLARLCELGLIQKEVPITEQNPLKSKLGRYKINDNYLAFWFYYVYKNYSLLEIENKEAVLGEIKMNFNDRFVSFVFEDVMRQLVLADTKLIGFKPKKIGRWWDNKNEIDLVAFDENNICFIECKWQNNINEQAILETLRLKSAPLIGTKNPSYKVFSKEWFCGLGL